MRRMLVLMGAGAAALAVAGAAAQVVASATGPAGSPASGCTGAEETLAASLGALPILDAHPDGVTPRGGREIGCDRDDALVSAGQSYDLRGAPSAWSAGPAAGTSTCRCGSSARSREGPTTDMTDIT